MFEDWFRVIFLPYARNLAGSKALIGDNLCSHLNSDVIKLCVENDIRFILLPANSTHICQTGHSIFWTLEEGLAKMFV